MSAAIEPRQLRDACGRFGTGVTVITTHCDGHDHGMTANAFMSVSLDPPLVAVSIARTAKMLSRIQKSGRFAVSVLADTMTRSPGTSPANPIPSSRTSWKPWTAC